MKTDSIILTVHNKEWLIQEVIKKIFENTMTKSELIIVLDGCTDKSEEKVNEILKLTPTNIKVKMIYTPDVFETRANNAGIKESNGDYIIIVQDDIIIKEPNWNLRMRKPVETFNDVWAVTARCAHNWEYNSKNLQEHLTDKQLDEFGNNWSDVLIHTCHANTSNTDRETFYIRDSVNRGPLLMKKEVFEKYGPFPEDFIQDMDDHFLNYKVYCESGLVSGYYKIDFISEDAWGGTRISGQPASWLLKLNRKNTIKVWKQYKNLIVGKKHDENRKLK